MAAGKISGSRVRFLQGKSLVNGEEGKGKARGAQDGGKGRRRGSGDLGNGERTGQCSHFLAGSTESCPPGIGIISACHSGLCKFLGKGRDDRVRTRTSGSTTQNAVLGTGHTHPSNRLPGGQCSPGPLPISLLHTILYTLAHRLVAQVPWPSDCQNTCSLNTRSHFPEPHVCIII